MATISSPMSYMLNGCHVTGGYSSIVGRASAQDSPAAVSGLR